MSTEDINKYYVFDKFDVCATINTRVLSVCIMYTQCIMYSMGTLLVVENHNILAYCMNLQ
jgi:hypothetical protein